MDDKLTRISGLYQMPQRQIVSPPAQALQLIAEMHTPRESLADTFSGGFST
jgi:hypothetical protein